MSWVQRVLKGGKKGKKRREQSRDNFLKHIGEQDPNHAYLQNASERARVGAGMERNWLKRQQKKAGIAAAVVATAVVGGAFVAPALAGAGGAGAAGAGAAGAGAAGAGGVATTAATAAGIVKAGIGIAGAGMSVAKMLKGRKEVPGMSASPNIPESAGGIGGGILPFALGAALFLLKR